MRLSPFVPAIYTTNFDDLLERTFAWAGKPCQVVAEAEDLHRWQVDRVDGARFVPRYPIYKLHGTLDRPGSLVIGEIGLPPPLRPRREPDRPALLLGRDGA